MNSTADKRRNFGVREDADSWARWWRRPAAPIAWRRLVGFLLLILLNVSVAGCDSVSALGPINRSAAHPTAVARTAGRLQVGDKIKIVVVGEEKISGDYEIDPEGSISVPVAGTMRVAGLTKSELERQLAQKLRSAQYLRDAMVTSRRSGRSMCWGKSKSPANIPITPVSASSARWLSPAVTHIAPTNPMCSFSGRASTSSRSIRFL
jgi:hypothetical protein